MRHYHLSFPFLLAYCLLTVQSCEDSVPRAEIDWDNQRIASGIVLKSAVTNYLESFQAIYVLKIDPDKADFEFCVGVPGGRVLTSTFADSCGAVAAINGTFFNMAEGYNTHFISIKDSIVSSTADGEFNSRATGVFCATGEEVEITYWTRDKEKDGAAEDDYAMVSGPLLMADNIDITLADIPFNTARHPRSFVAVTAKGDILLVAVDGRQPGYADGMNLFELRELAHILGCVDVLNLDGGGSTTLFVSGQGQTGVVNKPSGGVERAVASMLYVMKN
jgi:exopolysaccharide biosynthesis protein